MFDKKPSRAGTVCIDLTGSTPEPDYSKVATINFQEGSMSEDITELKQGLQDAGYTVEDNTQSGVLKVYREEGDE